MLPGRVLPGSENGWRGILNLCNLNTEQSNKNSEEQVGTEVVVDRQNSSQFPQWQYSMPDSVLRVETTSISRFISVTADFRCITA